MTNKPYVLELPVIAPGVSGSGPAKPPAPPAIEIASCEQPFVTGKVQTSVGDLPKISSQLTRRDHWGTVKARLGASRMHYAVDPGLYALGNPDASAPVLVSANYKMSFDLLRRSLGDRDAWILVLDTKGINVWCAAGKGTFGTDELVYRIEVSGLKKIVSHRKIILPQLGAPGVAAHLVKLLSGFRVYYGPVHAEDLPAYLDAGWKATKNMREMTFPLKDRAVLIPIEVLETLKPLLIIALAVLFLSAVLGAGSVMENLTHKGLPAVLALVLAVVAGATLVPLLLPWIPGRAFSVKGLILGLLIALGLVITGEIQWHSWSDRLETISWFLLLPAVSAYLAMNFTGCSTYTSLSGVKKEMRYALPAEIAAAALGAVLWITSLLLNREVPI